MARALTPTNIRAPFARYSHGIEVPAGRVSSSAPGSSASVPNDESAGEPSKEQASSASATSARSSARRASSFADIVRVNAYVTAREHMKGYMAVRDR